MRRRILAIVALLPLAVAPDGFADGPAVVAVVADPPRVELAGPNAHKTLLIHGRTADGRLVDLTRSARYEFDRDGVAIHKTDGSLRGLRDGETTITVRHGEYAVAVPVRVSGSQSPRAYHFENDVLPLLSRFGCNASGCHGKAEGQNGFKLSVFGFDPAADHAALTREGRGRRVLPAAPESSLLLTKAAGRVPHGGGNRVPVGSEAYGTIRGWIAAGCPVGDSDAPRVTSIRVEPAERVLGVRAGQQLRVIARYSDGSEADVTRHARFQSNNEPVAAVASDGLVGTADVPGEAAVMAGFMNEVAVCRVIVPRPEAVAFPERPAHNFIDRLVDAKLRKLNVAPSGPADDAEFLRRVYLDVIGTLPTAAEARAFLSDTRPDRRARLVDALLERPAYADYWALRWADVLRVDRAALGSKRAFNYYRWVRDGIAANKPFDRFAREIVAAEGPLDEVAPANFFRAVPKPGEAASTLSQVFLGVRIACAECHHHPFDRWGQDDYYGMAAFFAPVQVKKIGPLEALEAAGESSARNPRSGQAIRALPLGHGEAATAAGDQRRRLAEWLTAPGNPWFARNVANRYWAYFMGRGLVEPVDDVRVTNPPTNPELLDALARHVAETKFDLKALIRAITASRAYQTASRPEPSNERDEQNYSRSLLRPVPAEVLLDMVCQVTGVPEKFQGVAAGRRAVQLWDSKVNHYFLKLFGRPTRVSACECERNGEPNVGQVLHLLNSPEIDAKLRHDDGTVARLVQALPDDVRLVEELYLGFFARFPNDKEAKAGTEYMRKQPDRRRAAEDLGWALLNTLEFACNH